MQVVNNIDYESNYSQRMSPLFELGKESLICKFEKDTYEKFDFGHDDIDELIRLATDDSYSDIEVDSDEKDGYRFYYATIHAVYALGMIKAVKSIPYILDRMKREANDSDYLNESIVSYIGYMGSVGLKDFEEYTFQNPEMYDLITVFDGIDKILKYEPESARQIESIMMRYLNNAQTHPAALSFAISTLIDIGADKHIELIRKTFKSKDVDTMFRGDLEDIEIELGLRARRETPKPKNKLNDIIELYNSVSQQHTQPNLSVGRNDPCPCGSGKKYKKCCLNK